MDMAVEQTGTAVWPGTSKQVPWMMKFLQRLVSCRHRNLSRPFTRGRETYRTCVACGARRRLDPQESKMVGPFYYPESDLNSIYQRQ